MTSNMNRAISVLVSATLARCKATGNRPGQSASVQFGIVRAIEPLNADSPGPEGDRSRVAYAVQVADGTTTRIVTDRREIRIGDCVVVERFGESTNIRRSSANYCDPAAAASPTS
jgi:hypothetical protein